MAGDGPLLSVCRDLAKALGIENKVTFLGVLKNDRVAHAMATARAFVQHSVTAADGDSEGTPVGCMEASASGLPVITTRHQGLRELVVDGVTGYLVEERDVDAMAERMLSCARDPVLAGRMGSAGRAHVSGNFEVKQQVAKLVQLIRACV